MSQSETSADQVRMDYENLVRTMMYPFPVIPRSLYMDVFNRRSCGLCVLIQVKNKEVWYYDPRAIHRKAQVFHQIRVREALFWTIEAVKRNRIDDVEFVLNVADSVITTDRPHNYRLAESEPLPRPIVGATWCNFSSSLPYPIFFYDLLRRAFPSKLQYRRLRTLDEWEDRVLQYLSGEGTEWSKKSPKAIFRGANRDSQYVLPEDKNASCFKVGRSKLHRIGRQNTDVLDVVTTGSCGGQKIGQAAQYTLFLQQSYKYQIYVDGNGFWADRLPLLLFSQSCPVKQITPCQLFFEPLLKAWEHYIPTDYFFDDLVDNMKRTTDVHAREMAVRSQLWAKDYLSFNSIVTYAEVFLAQLGERLENRNFAIPRKAFKVFPVLS
ncbi:KDEL motif-containing protein 2 [Porphyridium purpureum]|uniref:KDEL motif-containing protein 2 n=1 Tax=Porphyridium purpureum TaxID=35688 RepID=A0A5J4YQS2_PORPP|nr:KDEL motif-containing protein 2 [Porphyridium purpureum]|eukprot:POR9476..scf222_8